MLPLLNLDDRQFEQWMSEARKAIQKRYPEWTDENPHDPGITLLELFSWLGEMQQFYLSQIHSSSERKFLQLLGTKLKEASRAHSRIELGRVRKSGWLPAGVKVYADDVPFETERSVYLLSTSIDKIIVRTEKEANDFTSSNFNDGVSFHAFGAESRKDNRFYVGLSEPLPGDRTIELFLKLHEDYPVPCGDYDPDSDSFIPSARVAWYYYGEDEEGAEGWRELTILTDETNHLSFTGCLSFRTVSPMKLLTLHPANDRPRYWLSCVLEEAGYELPPKFDSICINTVRVRQQETLADARLFQATGLPGEHLTLDDRLAFEGVVEVQVRQQDGCWHDWEQVDSFDGQGPYAEVFTIERDEESFRTIVTFGDGDKGVAAAAGAAIRVSFHEAGLQADRWLGSGSGLPHQSCELPWPAIVGDTFLLQIAEWDKTDGRLRWYDWQRVDDFDRSGAADRHYRLDRAEGTVRFGDHERGMAPRPSAAPNIRVISLQLGGGAHGNAKRYKIDRFAPSDGWWSGLTVTNPDDARGGADEEMLHEAKQRALLAIRQPNRAVTDEDYERLVKRTPGLRVARVKTLALYKPGLADYPQETAPAQTTVVVVPYTENRIPLPGPQFLRNVHRHIEPYRLITTELHVIPPQYVKITVHAVVIVEPSFKKDSPKILQALGKLLKPLDDGKDGKGWAFGRPVYKGDIYGLINQIPGVAYIQDLWLEADGTGVEKDRSGDIKLPPHGLVYSGEHRIECLSRAEI